MADERVYGFERATAEDVIRYARRAKGLFGSSPQDWDDRGPTVHVYVAKTPSGGIAAMTGTTPGSATCTLYTINASNQLAVTSPAQTETVYNISIAAKISGDSYLIVRREVLSGKFVVDGYLGYKPLIRFTLSAALATSDASKTGTIQTQYGPGVASPDTGSGAITLHNLLTSTGGVYVFEGASGAAGLAMWDSGTNYRILQMECPP